MTELEQKIKHFADEYYKGNELISDYDYDLLIAQLRKEQPDSELLDNVVGSDVEETSNGKLKLPVTMGTLLKCNSVDELVAWIKKKGKKDYMLELKIDGAGVLLEYNKGEFTRAYSRGNSVIAEDITNKVLQINDIPKKLKTNFTGYIRAEVYLKTSVFNNEFKSLGYKNPRNTVAGLLHSK